MKQIPVTPEIAAKIKAVVGEDVDTAGLAVFEAIAANTLPIPGKRGGIFEGATLTPLTLRQMANYILSNGVPLCEDHNMDGPPLGKLFDAQYLTDTNGLSLQGELRTLFYLDATEQTRIDKLNAGTIDEVSVGILASTLLCSECGWDYMGEAATFENVYTRTCGNGHPIGTDGVHAILSGLDQFYETSLVTRGAASNPKIVGKSLAKLPTASTSRLAAKGFEVERLMLTASKGEVNVDFDALVTKLTDKSADLATKTAELGVLQAAHTTATAALTAANERIATLEAASGAAEANAAEVAAAKTILGDSLKALMTAGGETIPAELPATIADLKAAIETRTANLTKLIPVGGSGAEGAGANSGPAAAPRVNVAAFQLNK